MAPSSARTLRQHTFRVEMANELVRENGDAAAAETIASSSEDERMTILGFGSLLSEKSSRLTFPELTNFRIGRVLKYRRIFGHPAHIFFERRIANMDTKEFSSLSAEYVNETFPGFICTVFEVSAKGMMEDGIPSQAFLDREQEFNITAVPYLELDGTEGKGILCVRSSDEEYMKRYGQERFDRHYGIHGIDTIWGWKEDSGLRPCATYLRHCTLAAESMGTECLDSFLDETFLVDRKSTVREYLEENPQVLTTLPPPELAVRYGG